jgi:DNA ligase-associated metallophosphoesterase
MQLDFRGHAFLLDPAGAAYWPARDLLIVADLHLEKGRAFARRGALLPPYDTHATLARLEDLVRRWRPATVVSLGDGFHDRRSGRELSPDLFDRLTALTRRLRWVWVTGNHDPAVCLALGGAVLPALELDDLVLRHEPSGAAGEIAGHLHPKARVSTTRLRLCRPCFAGDADRLLMPAFGAFTGGLNVLDPAIHSLFPSGLWAYMLGGMRVFRFPHSVLADEPSPAWHRLG